MVLFDCGPQLIRSAKSVARALDEEYRGANVFQVSVAEFLRPTRWMQRVSEQDDAGNLGGTLFCCRNLGPYPSTHRLSTYGDAIAFQLLVFVSGFNDGDITSLELRFGIRHVPALFHV